MSSIQHPDCRYATVLELCTHLVGRHHEELRETFPRIETLLGAVVPAHGGDRPELRVLQLAFAGLRAELEPHLDKEEEVLFPACVTLEQQGRALEEALIAGCERDHASIRDALAALRVLTDDYGFEGALCGTHRWLLDELASFELDLHRHIDEENGLLTRVGLGRAPGCVRRGSRRETCHPDRMLATRSNYRGFTAH